MKDRIERAKNQLKNELAKCPHCYTDKKAKGSPLTWNSESGTMTCDICGLTFAPLDAKEIPEIAAHVEFVIRAINTLKLCDEGKNYYKNNKEIYSIIPALETIQERIETCVAEAGKIASSAILSTVPDELQESLGGLQQLAARAATAKKEEKTDEPKAPSFTTLPEENTMSPIPVPAM